MSTIDDTLIIPENEYSHYITEAAEIIETLMSLVKEDAPPIYKEKVDKIINLLRRTPAEKEIINLVNESTVDHARKLAERDDYVRLSYLERGGYLPKDVVTGDMVRYFMHRGVSPTIILDWAFSCKFGPAYWRQPKTTESKDGSLVSIERTSANGLVFVKPCDRERLDGLIQEERKGWMSGQ